MVDDSDPLVNLTSSRLVKRVIRHPKTFEGESPWNVLQTLQWTEEVQLSFAGMKVGGKRKNFGAHCGDFKAFAENLGKSCESEFAASERAVRKTAHVFVGILWNEPLLAELRAVNADIAIAEFITTCP